MAALRENNTVSFRQKTWCDYSISLVPRILRGTGIKFRVEDYRWEHEVFSFTYHDVVEHSHGGFSDCFTIYEGDSLGFHPNGVTNVLRLPR